MCSLQCFNEHRGAVDPYARVVQRPVGRKYSKHSVDLSFGANRDLLYRLIKPKQEAIASVKAFKRTVRESESTLRDATQGAAHTA